MLNIIIFSLIVYCFSFVIIYKRPIMMKPWEWLMTIFGLKDSLSCMLCTSFWISGVLSLINLFILPQYPISPFLVLFGIPNTIVEYLGCIGMDMFSVASIVYLIDQFNSYFLEERGKLNVTIHNDKPIKQILND